MIDERHLDDLLREAGDELDRLAVGYDTARHGLPGARRERTRWLPIVASAAAVVVGVTGVALVRNERAAAPGGGADVSISSATTHPAGPVDTVVHVVVQGDYVAGIAAAYGVTIEAIAVSNGWADGVDHLIIPGEEVLVPAAGTVGATSTTAPAPVTEPDPVASLPYLMLVAPSEGLGQPTSIQTWNGKGFEPPAHLLGWVDPGADAGFLVPVVVSPQWMEPFPDARDVDRGNVTGWVINVGDVTVGSFKVDGMSASIRVESGEIPDSDVIALMSGLPPSLEVEWGAGDGPPEAFVEIARQADDAYLHVTTYADEEGASPTFGTLTDYPLNGLTLEGGPTVSQVQVGAHPGFVLRTTTAGVATATLYWPCGETYRCMLGYSGGVNTPSDAQLVALAQRTRPATPDEIADFEEM